MMFASWFRRLFGGTPGVPCNLCHCNIPASDIEKGLAVVVARKKYCRGCVEEITHQAGRNAGFTLTDVGSSSAVLPG